MKNPLQRREQAPALRWRSFAIAQDDSIFRYFF